MKAKLFILGTMASMVVPCLSLHADGMISKKKVAAGVTADANAHKDREYVLITTRSVTGSNIPMVVRSYHGQVTTAGPVSSYSQHDLQGTGALDVGSALVKRDPSIVFTRH